MGINRMPDINVRKAVLALYSKPELRGKDIRDIFDNKATNHFVLTSRKLGRARMLEVGCPSFSTDRVNTRCYFEAIGYPPEELEANYKKLKKLGLLDETATVDR